MLLWHKCLCIYRINASSNYFQVKRLKSYTNYYEHPFSNCFLKPEGLFAGFFLDIRVNNFKYECRRVFLNRFLHYWAKCHQIQIASMKVSKKFLPSETIFMVRYYCCRRLMTRNPICFARCQLLLENEDVESLAIITIIMPLMQKSSWLFFSHEFFARNLKSGEMQTLAFFMHSAKK